MGLSSAMQWWEEWQLRILVLVSIFIQYVLFFSLWVRSSRRLRVLVWIAYIGGDAVAIYALATLFNRRKQSWDGASSALEILWAPVLLIHLAGQPMITAYSLEDNELWKRHTITLVSQVTVALYIFCKWWSGEKTLLAAAILLFLMGISKFAQKPWALRTASFNSMQTSSSALLLPAAQREGGIYSLEEYVQAAKKCVLETKVDSSYECEIESNYMFVDLSTPYSFRIAKLPSFLMHEDKLAYKALRVCLEDTFSNLYTRVGSVETPLSSILFLLLPLLALSSTILFATSHKDGQNEKDIWVTYILFGCITILEFFLPCIAICINIFPYSESFFDNLLEWWHDSVSQCNIMSFCVRKKNPTFLMKLATFNILREFVNQHWYIQQVPTAYQITRLVRRHVEDGWNNYIQEGASYRRFNEVRGQWAVRRHPELGWSLRKPFDESVLMWHIATDLCFYDTSTSSQRRQGEATQHSREISNYMVYLLLIRPEMLMPGTRSALFTMTNANIMESSKGPFDTEEMLVQEILKMPMQPIASNIVSDACNLAKALMDLVEKERWTVIQGVWMEMLCYSASRCRGYLHAKGLSENGEYLSMVWLLWAFMGMETLADRHQKSEPPQEKEEV